MKAGQLSRESRMLIDAARDGDDPSAADRKRVRAGLARKLAVGVAAGAVAATASHAAAGGVSAAAGTSGAAAGAAAAAAGAAATAASVGVAGGVAAGTGAAAGTASIAAGAMATGLGAKLLVSVAIVGALGAGSVSYVRHESAKRAVAQTHAVAVDRAVAGDVPAAPAVRSAPVAAHSAPSPVAIPDLPPSPPAAAPPVATPARAVAAATPSVATPSPLDAELALLQEVHGALQQKDGARALRLLDEHSRRFPSGPLAEESEAARVFALCALGRADEARDVAGRFLREHPRSPLAPRVTRACDEPSTF